MRLVVRRERVSARTSRAGCAALIAFLLALALADDARAAPIVQVELVTSQVYDHLELTNGVIVTATARAIKVPGPGCDKVDVFIVLDGPGAHQGQTAAYRIAVPFTGEVTVTVNPKYFRAAFAQQGVAYGRAQCGGLPPQGPVESSRLPFQIPAIRTETLPPRIPQDPRDDRSLNQSQRDSTEATAKAGIGAGAISCTAAAVIGAPFSEGMSLLALSICGGSAVGAAGAGTVLLRDPPDGRFGELYPADFAPRRFNAAPVRCGRVARRQLSARGCRRFRPIYARWARLTREMSWLFRAAGVSANRWSTARALPDGADRDRFMALQHAAIQMYLTRIELLQFSRRPYGSRLAALVRGSRVERRFGVRFRTRALKRFGNLRSIPRAVVRSLEADGYDVAGSVRAMTGKVAVADVPRRLSRVFLEAPARPSPERPPLQPGAVADLLAAWLGDDTRLQGLQDACGAAYAMGLASGRDALPDAGARYRHVLAEQVLLLSSGLERPCIPGPSRVVDVPDPDSDPGPRQIVAPEPGQALFAAQDIAVTRTGELLVADQTAQLIRRYTLDGQPRGTIGGPGDQDGQFISPVGVAADAAGRVYVTDFELHRVQRFSPGGSFELAWGTQGTAPGALSRPTGIAIAPSGEVVVAEQDNRRLQVFSSDGVSLRVIEPPPSPEPGYLASPRGIAVGADGRIAVAELDGSRVVQFGADGAFLGETSAAVGLKLPYDVAFDSRNRVWVADRTAGRLHRLVGPDRSDKTIASLGPDPVSFIAPTALAFASGSMFALDFASQRVFRVPERD